MSLLDNILIDGKFGNRIKEVCIKKYHYSEWLNINEFSNKYGFDELKWTQKVFNYMFNIIELPTCKCGKSLNFRGRIDCIYTKYCGNKCSSIYNADERIKTLKRNNIERWGVENVFQLESIKEKSKVTCLEKYGVENINKCKKFRKKIEETNLERYGVKSYTQTSEYLEKSKVTCLAKYGVESVLQSNEIRSKIKNTWISKYGEDNPNKSSVVRDKILATNMEKYGVINPSYSNEIKDKISKSIKEYHVNNIEKTNRHAEKWNLHNLLYLSNQVYEFTCNKCGNRQKMSYYLIYNRNKHRSEICLTCNPLYSTYAQNEVCEFVMSLVENVYVNKRFKSGLYTKGDYEIDIYLPDFNIGIEFNGIYWHSEFYKEKTYHLDKKDYFTNMGITLVQIWEDDWKYKKEIVKSIISNKLSKNENKIFARKCIIKQVPLDEKVNFLNSNHLQGDVRSSINIGLYYENKLVSLMTFGERRINSKSEFELIRFCNLLNTTIVGGASKLFNFFIKNYKFKSIISYSDNSISNGDLYKTLGFVNNTKSTINYYWCDNKVKYHRFNFNKKKLVRDGYDPSKTEVEIMHERGYYRIFGVGNKKWKYETTI